MNFLRSIFLNFGLWLWAVCVGVCCLPTLIRPAWTQATILMWSRGATAWTRLIMGIEYHVHGLENLPAGACIIASKHQSAWETFALLTVIPNMRVVMKKSILWLPFIGWYLYAAQHLAIDRTGNAKTLREMLVKLKKLKNTDTRLLIFPEGTRVYVGQSPDLLIGALGLAKLGRLPIVPVSLNSGLVWPRNSFFKKPGIIDVRICPPLDARLEKTDLLVALHRAINLEPATGAAKSDGMPK
jgi:1-acyl-sn-glycerol-3-phosphate acyltransferase